MAGKPAPYNEPSPARSQHHRLITPDDAIVAIREKVRAVPSGRAPLVVFDLDGTLFDNRVRSQRIMIHLAEQGGGRLHDDVRNMVMALPLNHMQYGVVDTLKGEGIEDQNILDYFLQGWFDNFFTDEWVKQDIPTPGAQDFVKRVLACGVKVVYLTGRDTPNMRKGTLESLKQHGFPMPDEERIILITKPTFETPDLDFKQAAIDQLQRLGDVVATFDNEPKMNNTLASAFSGATHIFLDTLHSGDWEPLNPEIVVMTDFRLQA